MKIAHVEATGSGGSRAEDSEARAQGACYGARPGGRPRRPGRASAGKAGTASLAKTNALCAERRS